MRRPILVLALLAATMAARADDLLQVWAQARAADPLLRQAAALAGAQEASSREARAALLPRWSLQRSDQRDNGGKRSNTTTSSLSQTLVDLAALREWDASRSQASAQAARLAAAEQAARARVAEAYFGLLSAQAQLATARANEDAFDRQVNEAETRFKAGLSAQVEADQSRAYRELARSSTLAAELALADAREALAQLTGAAAPTLQPLRRDLAAQPLPDDADAWARRAEAANPGLRALQLDVQASEQRIASARAGHLPTLSLGLDTTRQRGDGVPLSDAGRTPTQLALRLSVPLFSGGATTAAADRAGFQREAAREQLEAGRRAVLREVRAEHLAVGQGAAQLRSAQSAVAAAERALGATRTGLALGTRSTTDLLLAIQTLGAAQNAQAQARHHHVLALLALHQAAGSLGDAELAAVNSLLETR
ncbi:TolC family outer membrane protein [Pelomonas aquatica]|jgi:outer membrane protein|uniref:Type I secretion protein TolC n=1 Tax=Pelomonas aquatica TaxID=431058 RepID=A0A9X4LHH8_9BURK|nr:TolC family outer membrane protein [Pelomonas aquatica]MCY4756063.1 TolC family outer membrane protein [Pelomonas aquatica]MDG0864121.1 type I secretion protein TolC [Pelomonas aquatica]